MPPLSSVHRSHGRSLWGQRSADRGCAREPRHPRQDVHRDQARGLIRQSVHAERRPQLRSVARAVADAARRSAAGPQPERRGGADPHDAGVEEGGAHPLHRRDHLPGRPARADAASHAQLPARLHPGRLFDRQSRRRRRAADINVASWAQYFLKYVISHPAVTCAIPGSTRLSHLVDNQAAGRGRLPDAAMRRKMEEYWDAKRW
ncbi:MAG: hypothetical protein E6K41_12635 [Gammaproteobacteria bacterium]|nr:MAG: hypothetical protein E6K41_12635 [Gammaproteobacteria bacterium]TLZ32509.1 MAG: hypothetical protein E6K29_01325 [Gammaproteobacteria bacterium]